jgi:hypothetical protein
VIRPRTTIALLLLLLLPLWNSAKGQDTGLSDPPRPVTTQPHISFAFERKGLPVPKYELTISEDGTGTYQGVEVQQTTGGTYVATADLASREFKRPVALSSTTVARIFKLSQQLNRFNKPCASKAKNIADQGTKTLTYTGPDGSGSCTYNFTENKDVQTLTEIFQGIAETLDQGRTLDQLHRYDRLGLDASIKFLADEVSSGHALEVGTIAASLHSIAADPDVMERVRARANTLLALVATDASSR